MIHQVRPQSNQRHQIPPRPTRHQLEQLDPRPDLPGDPIPELDRDERIQSVRDNRLGRIQVLLGGHEQGGQLRLEAGGDGQSGRVEGVGAFQQLRQRLDRLIRYRGLSVLAGEGGGVAQLSEFGVRRPVRLSGTGGGAAEVGARVDLRVRVLVLDRGAEEGEEFAFRQHLVAIGGADGGLSVCSFGYVTDFADGAQMDRAGWQTLRLPPGSKCPQEGAGTGIDPLSSCAKESGSGREQDEEVDFRFRQSVVQIPRTMEFWFHDGPIFFDSDLLEQFVLVLWVSRQAQIVEGDCIIRARP